MSYCRFWVKPCVKIKQLFAGRTHNKSSMSFWESRVDLAEIKIKREFVSIICRFVWLWRSCNTFQFQPSWNNVPLAALISLSCWILGRHFVQSLAAYLVSVLTLGDTHSFGIGISKNPCFLSNSWPWQSLVVNKCTEDRGQQTLRGPVLVQTWSAGLPSCIFATHAFQKEIFMDCSS